MIEQKNSKDLNGNTKFYKNDVTRLLMIHLVL